MVLFLQQSLPSEGLALGQRDASLPYALMPGRVVKQKPTTPCLGAGADAPRSPNKHGCVW